MVDQIVGFISQATAAAVDLAEDMFVATGMWGIVFAGISVILICKFLLGPLLGFTASGASDMARSVRSKSKNKAGD